MKTLNAPTLPFPRANMLVRLLQRYGSLAAGLAASAFLASGAIAKPPPGPTPGVDSNPGALFTTDATLSKPDINIYAAKEDVYIYGSPKNGAKPESGLPPGDYYVQVTDPSGAVVLGIPNGTVHVGTNGTFGLPTPLQLWLLVLMPDSLAQGYNDTPNPGSEYKVWISLDPTFTNSTTKTDNFKVKKNDGGGGGGGIDTALLTIVKFYDTNADGVWDPLTEPEISGWLFHVSNNLTLARYSGNSPIVGLNPTQKLTLTLSPGTYDIFEANALEVGWVHTTVASVTGITLVAGDNLEYDFGNVFVGPKGGLTLGFWSNKNGQALITPGDIAGLVALNLRTGSGSNFNPGTKADVKSFLLSANATNMANMLSAQLTAMYLNVNHSTTSGISGSDIIYRPELIPYGITNNDNGFLSLTKLITEANLALADPNGATFAGSPVRTYQEKLKNALDDANNNKAIYVQPPSPLITFTFSPSP